jgi:hypothetical protein
MELLLLPFLLCSVPLVLAQLQKLLLPVRLVLGF